MKKIKVILLIPIVLLMTSGCMYVKTASIDEVVESAISSKHKAYNVVNKGYKYYLPKGLSSKRVDEYNDIIKSATDDYYLYVDIVSYNDKISFIFEENKDAYYSKVITENDKKKGTINVYSLKNDEYLIKVIYNYATVEVKCDKTRLKTSLINSIYIAESVKYNDDVIKKLLANSVIDSTEEQVIIFDDSSDVSNTLEVDDTYTGDETKDYDPDVIN